MKPQDKRKVSVLTYFIILQSVDKDITNYEFELHTALTSLIREKNIITQVQFQIFLGFCKQVLEKALLNLSKGNKAKTSG